MPISSISSVDVAAAQAAAASVVPKPVKHVEKNAGNDGDKDDHAPSSQAVKSTTNSVGETIGTTISTKA